MTEDWQVCGAVRHVGDDHDPTVEWRDLGLLCEACFGALVDRRDIAVTDEMVERAAEAYEFGVMPGDESEATMDEKRSMARRVLTAAFAAHGEPNDQS